MLFAVGRKLNLNPINLEQSKELMTETMQTFEGEKKPSKWLHMKIYYRLDPKVDIKSSIVISHRFQQSPKLGKRQKTCIH